jgi:hypothetical protein
MSPKNESLLRCLKAVAGASTSDLALPHDLYAVQDLRDAGHIFERDGRWQLTLGGLAWVNTLAAAKRAEEEAQI